jgi:hypothetical protein
MRKRIDDHAVQKESFAERSAAFRQRKRFKAKPPSSTAPRRVPVTAGHRHKRAGDKNRE